MEPLYKRRYPCMICRAPVSPCPSPEVAEIYSHDLAPVVCTSVLLSVYYPQYTGYELESKIKGGKINRGLGSYNGNLLALQSEKDECKEEMGLPELASNGKPSESGRSNIPRRTSPGFFLDIAHLQKQLVAGQARGRMPLLQNPAMKLRMSSSNKHNQLVDQSAITALSQRPRHLLFPPLLDVWTQNDAIQRSIRLQI